MVKISEKIKNFPIRKLLGLHFFLFAILRSFYLAIKKFKESKASQTASTLTYYSLLSIIPILAFSFYIADILKVREFLEKGIQLRLQEHEELLNHIFLLAHTLIQKTKAGVLSIGTLLLFVSTAKLVNSIDRGFQDIWKKRKRKWKKRLIIYLALLFVAFIFLILSGIVKVLIVQDFAYFLQKIYFFQIVSYLLIFLPFTFLYFLIPNVKVKFSSAILGAIASSIIYECIQWGYFFFQKETTRLGYIYGSFAALPFFLIWLKISWMIFLFGATITYSLENLNECESEKDGFKISKRYSLLLSIFVVYKSISNNSFVTKRFLYEKLNIFPKLSKKILNDLVEAKIFFKKKERYYLVKNKNTLTFYDILSSLNLKGINKFNFIDFPSLERVEKTLSLIETKDLDPKNVFIKDI